jgi:hypothetical protein
MLIEAGESEDKLLVVDGEVWVEQGDDMSGQNALETRMRRRAGSKSRVRVGVDRHDEPNGILGGVISSVGRRDYSLKLTTINKSE